MLSNYTTGGRIEDRKLVLDDQEAFRVAMWRMKPGPVVVRIEQVQERRTDAANRYHWGVVIKMIADETGQEKDDIHYDMCDRFLRRHIQYLDPASGLTVERDFPVGSSGLTVREFYEFVEKVRLFAAEFFGLTIPDPDPAYVRERERAMQEAA